MASSIEILQNVTTGTIKMRSTFDNPKGVLFPNQFVNVRLLVDTMTGVTLAPNAAIRLFGQARGRPGVHSALCPRA